ATSSFLARVSNPIVGHPSNRQGARPAYLSPPEGGSGHRTHTVPKFMKLKDFAVTFFVEGDALGRDKTAQPPVTVRFVGHFELKAAWHVHCSYSAPWFNGSDGRAATNGTRANACARY